MLKGRLPPMALDRLSGEAIILEAISGCTPRLARCRDRSAHVPDRLADAVLRPASSDTAT
jgi:hypothetical protein